VKRQPYLHLQTVPTSEPNQSTASTALKDFPLLSAELAEQNMPNQSISTDADARARPNRSHLNQYINDLSSTSSSSAIVFWHQKQESKAYSILPLIALDYVSAPASQASIR